MFKKPSDDNFKRLYGDIEKKRQDAFERDQKVLNDNKTPRIQPTPNIVLAPQVIPIGKPRAPPATGITEALNAIGAVNINK